MLDFTVSSGCDIPGRAMDSAEDSRTILCATPPPIFVIHGAETVA